MKRKMQKLSTKQLINYFNEMFETSHLSNEILYLLPDSKQRRFIIDKLLYEFTSKELSKMLDE